MKTLKMNFFYLFLLSVSISFTNCESDSTSNEEQNSEELALVDFEKQISNIKSNLGGKNGESTSKSTSYVAAKFDIRMEGENYIIENIRYLNEFEYGFAEGFSNQASKSIEGGGIKVSCEKTGEITECPELSGIGAGMRQARCVGNAVKACLDGGGCAEVCSMEAEIKQ
ncbi:hypothetical protein [Polaribacter sp. HL-MS24]|uniref:hypothetical protein n=1 Tax=Polaribacter sp. HL-MS24 TaxID=3077735 RepID=UPI002934FE0F|nr:hypothetical protein [Polaribacter sp. HL-MS24]WOC40126.1 hypothetical protein RRF69_11030 [Polaribacter sp. HL-MS24]